eukprot:scaffold231200_cov16-Prasinocladus_malaysianus.AAC.1
MQWVYELLLLNSHIAAHGIAAHEFATHNAYKRGLADKSLLFSIFCSGLAMFLSTSTIIVVIRVKDDK